MVSCQLCQTQASPEFLFTACSHAICLHCCYTHTDFTISQITCCGISTHVDRDSMTEIIRNKKACRDKDRAEFRHSPLASCVNTDSRSVRLSREGKGPLFPEGQHRKSQKENSLGEGEGEGEREGVLGRENCEEMVFSAFPRYTFQGSSCFSKHEEQQSNSKDVNELQNVLNLQIGKVREQFDREHQDLNRREDLLIKDLIRAYEEQISQERPQHSRNFAYPIDPVADQPQKGLANIYKQQAAHQNFETCHYDHIIKKLEMNQQRMSQRIQHQFHSLV